MTDYVEILKDIVNIPSGTNNKEGVNNVGKYLIHRYNQIGLKSQSFSHPEYGDMVYVSKSGDVSADSKQQNRILLVGHMDTVYNHIESPIVWEEGARLFGPGVCDMKSGLITILGTVETLFEEGISLENVGILLVAEEEQMLPNRYPAMADIAKAHTHAMIYESQELGWFKPNMLPIVVQRRGFYSVVVTIKGPGGHSGLVSQKENFHNAIHTFLDVGRALVDLADFDKGTSVNIGLVKGGTAVNALAEETRLEVSARFSEPKEYKRIVKAFNDVPKEFETDFMKIEITEDIVCPTMPYTDKGKDFFKVAKEALAKIGVKGEEEKRGSGSDASRLIHFNPDIAVLDHFGAVGGGEHIETEEFIFKESLGWAIKNSVQVVKAILESYAE